MNLHNFNRVIFDFDHTLAELVIDWSRWSDGIKLIARRFDPNFDYDGFVSYEQINQLTQQHGEPARQAMLAFNQHYESEQLLKVIPNDQALKALWNLRPTQKAYLLSSNARTTLLPVLAQLEITDLFQTIVTREDVTFIKPDPAPFQLIHTDGVALVEYVMVGDSRADEGFARNVGIAFIPVDQLEI